MHVPEWPADVRAGHLISRFAALQEPADQRRASRGSEPAITRDRQDLAAFVPMKRVTRTRNRSPGQPGVADGEALPPVVRDAPPSAAGGVGEGALPGRRAIARATT
jgi:hypothetical protein